MGRKKLEAGQSVKDKVFEVLDNNNNAVYEDVTKMVSLKETTFRTILSQYRKEKGIVVKRGRRKKVND